MKTDKIAEVLESETRFWNMRESDIRGRAVLDYDALMLIADKLNTLTLAQEQLDDIIAVFDSPASSDVSEINVLSDCIKDGEKIYKKLSTDFSRSKVIASHVFNNYVVSYHAKKCGACSSGGEQ